MMKLCSACLSEEKNAYNTRYYSRFKSGEEWYDRQAKCSMCHEIEVADQKIESFASNFRGTPEELEVMDSDFLVSALTHFLDKKQQEKCPVILSELKKRNWNPDSLDAEGLPMMVKATKAGCLEVVKLLVEQFNASIEVYDGQKGNALICAVCERQFDIFLYLLDRFHAQIKEKDAQQLFNDQMEGRLPVSIAQVYNTTLLLLACKNSAPVEVIAKLLDIGANVNGRGYSAYTPLMMACEATPVSLATVKLLISRGANVNAANDSKKTPLFVALKAEASFEVIKLLVESGANVEFSLEQACKAKAPFEAVKLLIQSGNHKYLKTDKSAFYSVLKECVEIDSIRNDLEKKLYSSEEILEITKLLLEKGVNINSTDRHGNESVLGFACKSDAPPAVVRFLIEAGAEIDDFKDDGKNGTTTALHCACSSKAPSFEKIKLLINSGADLNAKNWQGCTPLLLATIHDADPEIIKLLVDCGAEMGASKWAVKDQLRYRAYSGYSLAAVKALLPSAARVDNDKEFILRFCDTGNLDIIKHLVEECGVDMSDPRQLNNEESSPIRSALESRRTTSFDTIKYLVDHGARVNAFCYQQATAEMVEYFISKGADVNQKSWDRSPLWMALDHSIKIDYQAIALLVQHGADVNAAYDYLPLFVKLCRRCPPLEIVKLFIDAGAKINAKDRQSLTPLITACKNKASPEVIQLLVEAGADVSVQGHDELGVDENKKKFGSTALYWACMNWYPVETIKLLAERDSDPLRLPLSRLFCRQDTLEVVSVLLTCNSSKLAQRLLIDACSTGASLEVIKMLVVANANDINYSDTSGMTPLLHACLNHNSLDVIKCLVEAGADVNAQIEKQKQSHLHMACTKIASLDIIKYLVASGANANAADANGKTPFMLACNALPVVTRELIDLFVSSGAEIEACGKRPATQYGAKNRATTFISSCGKMSLEDTKYFISLGASLDADYIMAAACKNGASPEVIQFLIDQGKPVDNYLFGDEGRQFSPLLHLCSNGASAEAVKLILDAGADVDSVIEEKSALLIASRSKRVSFDVVKLLVDYGADVNMKTQCVLNLHYLEEDETRASIIFLRLRHARTH